MKIEQTKPNEQIVEASNAILRTKAEIFLSILRYGSCSVFALLGTVLIAVGNTKWAEAITVEDFAATITNWSYLLWVLAVALAGPDVATGVAKIGTAWKGSHFTSTDNK